ncbi:hypothetical protein GEMRC1_012853 [Eukaryota sp. GEM-RC1]
MNKPFEYQIFNVLPSLHYLFWNIPRSCNFTLWTFFCHLCIKQWLDTNGSCPTCGLKTLLADSVHSSALHQAADPVPENFSDLVEISPDDLQLDDSNFLENIAGDVVRSAEWNNCVVAVKMVNKATHSEELLHQEVSQMLPLSHPHVLPVFGITRLPEHIGIVMELGSGHLQVPTSLSPTTLSQAIGICTAVQFLHSKGIVHYNIKSENVIIVNSRVKISDLGSPQTVSSSLQVSPKCIPPEAFKSVFGSAFDIYSLGILLYEMFSNGLAFDGMSTSEVINVKEREHLFRYPPGFPLSISSLIGKCLSVNPSERPSINHVLKRLKEFQVVVEAMDLDNSANAVQTKISDDDTTCEVERRSDDWKSQQMNNLGNSYKCGDDVHQNYTVAVYWFPKSC